MIEVLVLDRSEANFHDTDALGEPLRPRAVVKNPTAHLREINLVSDAPGRSFNRMAGIHQSYGERHTVRDHETHEFVRRVAGKLADVLHTDDCTGVYLIAAPRLLAQLRKALSSAARARVLGELPKDLRRNTPAMIAKRLLAARPRLQLRKGSFVGHNPSALIGPNGR